VNDERRCRAAFSDLIRRCTSRSAGPSRAADGRSRRTYDGINWTDNDNGVTTAPIVSQQ
jgi:hypothetical protein